MIKTNVDMLDKNTPIPLYFQLEEILKEKIETEELQPGDLLSSEKELSEKYKISRPTVRQALRGLVSQGLLYREKGKGTFVAKPKIDYGFIQRLTTFYDDMIEKGYTTKTKVIKQEVKTVRGAIAKKLDIQKGEKVIFLSRIRFIENEPIVSVMNFIPYKLCPDLINEDLENKSLYRVLTNKYGLKPYRAEITLEPIVASKYDSRLLNMEENASVHLIKNIIYTKENIIMDYFESHFKGDKGKFVVELCK
ncbi:MAG: GntR family transcriptional regulator [Candidatus Atribacteria bacterium]